MLPLVPLVPPGPQRQQQWTAQPCSMRKPHLLLHTAHRHAGAAMPCSHPASPQLYLCQPLARVRSVCAAPLLGWPAALGGTVSGGCAAVDGCCCCWCHCCWSHCCWSHCRVAAPQRPTWTVLSSCCLRLLLLALICLVPGNSLGSNSSTAATSAAPILHIERYGTPCAVPLVIQLTLMLPGIGGMNRLRRHIPEQCQGQQQSAAP